MAQATQASKVVEYGDTKVKFEAWADRLKAINTWESNEGEKVATKARNFRAVLVYDMKRAGFKESGAGSIADILGITKGDVQKLVTRGIALELEIDVTTIQEAVDAGGNGITKAKIEAIASNEKLSKSDRKAQLIELGLKEKQVKPRDTKGGKGKKSKAELTAKDVKAIEAIVKRATTGATNPNTIWDKLALALDEVGGIHA